MLLWTPGVADILSDFFTTGYVDAAIIAVLIALSACFAFSRVTRRYESKAHALVSAMAVSSSLWIFLYASLLFCIALVHEYLGNPGGTILAVAAISFLPALLLGPLAFYLLRKRALRQIYPYFYRRPLGRDLVSDGALLARANTVFSEIKSMTKVPLVDLSVVPSDPNFPLSAALDWKQNKVVAIADSVLASLDDEELRSVLAHEVGHIAHKDSFKKMIATAYRTAFPFDPAARFAEAAIYRNAEFAADDYSAFVTRKPAALASALLKIYEASRSVGSSLVDSAAISSLTRRQRHEQSLFSKEPPLPARIRRLLELETALNSVG
jgi:heat shock protein HtpX